MAQGLPDQPPEEYLELFVESEDDESCPTCGWDSSDASLDTHQAFNNGALLAIENAEGSVFMAQAATQLICKYWRCPNIIDNGQARQRCATLFTTEEDITTGAMT